MHPNPIFRRTPEDTSLAFARERGFGTLAVNHPGGPLLAHVPFVLAEDGTMAELHLVRSNPVAAADGEAVIAVSGADGYISPDWYGLEDQVPTWNYIAVHLRGRLERRPQAELRGMLDRLTAHFEERLAPKPPWRTDKMTPEALDRMMRAVVPFHFHVDRIDSTWKLGQNKDPAARASAAAHLGQSGIGMETADLPRQMRDAN